MFGGVWWIIGVIAAVWVIVDVWTKRKSMDQTMKIVWSIAAVLLSIITAIVYYFIVVNKK
jgi:prolipoprotein diacylglyceryltransferase